MSFNNLQSTLICGSSYKWIMHAKMFTLSNEPIYTFSHRDTQMHTRTHVAVYIFY